MTIHGDAAFAAYDGVVAATDEDWATEYLALDISAAVVPDLDAAIEHIRRCSTGHTEAIVTGDLAAARRFAAEVDAAAVLVNALDPVHRRRRVRLRRRDRHQHPEAARPRPDGAARDDLHQVRRHRRRPRALTLAVPGRVRAMSTLLQAAAEEPEMCGGVNHWVVGGIVLAILLAALLALLAFGARTRAQLSTLATPPARTAPGGASG